MFPKKFIHEISLGMTEFVQPVILCGGSGTRLWPLSRAGFPKQFLCLKGAESLFQQATQRLVNLSSIDIKVAKPIVVTGEQHRFLVVEQLREVGIGISVALLEPVGRNTAPALTMAALAAQAEGSDPILVVSPADQTVENAACFTQAIHAAIKEAASGNIAILGVAPVSPETGYGYIQVSKDSNQVARLVHRFIEKPSADMARQLINEGGYYWNAGIFVLKASVWLNALTTFRPDISSTTAAAWNSKTQDNIFFRPSKDVFAAIPSESIDYAVIERCPGSNFSIKMVALAAGWSDLGTWDAVWNALPKDDHGNVHQGDVLNKDSCNTLVHASSRLVSLVGVKDIIVIETSDAVLVADKARSQDVKHIVGLLQTSKREEHSSHRKVHRPWGWFDSIDEGGRFKVKRIQVKPGASLSLQKHHHRAEHWVVVTGTAEITSGDKKITLTENQSTYIPLGEVHRLANPGITELEIIEIQSGSYLGEDDIIRFEDEYGRNHG